LIIGFTLCSSPLPHCPVKALFGTSLAEYMPHLPFYTYRTLCHPANLLKHAVAIYWFNANADSPPLMLPREATVGIQDTDATLRTRVVPYHSRYEPLD
jgi:hypothetical protein